MNTSGGAAAEEQVGRRPPRRLLLLLASFALFGTILWFGGTDSWTMVLTGDVRLYLAAFVLSGLIPSLSAWRLRALVEAATGAPAASWLRFLHINMTAVALGLILPRNAALLGTKATYLRAMGVPLLRGTSAALSENIIDLMFLSALVLPCLLVIVGGAGPGGFLAGSAACLSAMLLIALGVRGRDWRGRVWSLMRRLPIPPRWLPAAEGAFLPGPVRALSMLAATVVIHGAMILRAYVIALAIGLEPHWIIFAAAYPLTQIGLALAVAPGALGTLDASWVGLLILLGLPNDEALSFTVALRACIVVFPVAWYGVTALLVLMFPPDASESMGPPPARAPSPDLES